MTSSLQSDIVEIVNHIGEVEGTGNLAKQTNASNLRWLRLMAQRCAKHGQIIIVHDRVIGRGHKTRYISRKNRNSPGYPRRTR